MKPFTVLLVSVLALIALTFGVELPILMNDLLEPAGQTSVTSALVNGAGTLTQRSTTVLPTSTIMIHGLAIDGSHISSCIIIFGQDRCCASVDIANCSDDDFTQNKCTVKCRAGAEFITSRAIPTFKPSSLTSIISESFGTTTILVIAPTSFLTVTQTSSSIATPSSLSSASTLTITSSVTTRPSSSMDTLAPMTTTSTLTTSSQENETAPLITGSSSSSAPSISEATQSLFMTASSAGIAKTSRTQKQHLRPSIVVGITVAALSVVGIVAVAVLYFRRDQIRRNEERVSYMLPLSSRETFNAPVSTSHRPIIKKGTKISAPVRVQKQNDSGKWEDGIGDMKTRSIEMANFHRLSRISELNV